MPNFESHTLVGHVGADAVLRTTREGIPVANFSLAVNDRRNKDAPPVWYRVTCWRGLAEIAAQYVRRGDPVLVQGDRLVLSEWTDDTGAPRYTLELTAQTLTLLGGSRGDAGDGDEEGGHEVGDLPF